MNTTAASNRRAMGSGSLGRAVIRAAFLLPLILAASGCRIRIEVPEGGRVESTSGVFSCGSGQTCDIDVIDFLFDETLKAIPEEGYLFRKWGAGDHQLCGGRIAQPCRISTMGQENNLAIQQFLASDEVFHLKPIFNRGSCHSIKELEDHSQWVGPLSYYQYTYQQCSLPGASEPVYHGQFRTYRSVEPLSGPGNSLYIRCAIDYDLGDTTASAVYDWDGLETVPLIRQQLRLDGSWRITHYDIDGFMEVEPGEFNDRLVISEEIRSEPYVFDDCFPDAGS